MNIDATNAETVNVDAGPGDDVITIHAAAPAGAGGAAMVDSSTVAEAAVAASNSPTGIVFASIMVPSTGSYRVAVDHGGTFRFLGGNGAVTATAELRVVVDPQDEAAVLSTPPIAQFTLWPLMVQGGTVHVDIPIPAWPTSTVLDLVGGQTVVAALSANCPDAAGAVASGAIRLTVSPV